MEKNKVENQEVEVKKEVKNTPKPKLPETQDKQDTPKPNQSAPVGDKKAPYNKKRKPNSNANNNSNTGGNHRAKANNSRHNSAWIAELKKSKYYKIEKIS